MSRQPGCGADRKRILQLAEELAFPRYPGTAGDRRAIALVASRLQETGVEVTQEWFTYDIAPAWRALRALLVVTGLLVGCAGLLAARFPLSAGLALGIAFTAAGTLLLWAPWLERLYRRQGATRTANVVGRRTAVGPRARIILIAHHDSKSQNLTLPARAGLTLAAVVGAVGLLLLVIVEMVAPDPRTLGWLGPALGGVSAVSLWILATLRSGNESPGGVDNAGSVAILVELARSLTAALPEDVELVFLSTGAEEDHMVGAMRWLDAHRDELSACPAVAINLDGAGIPGRVVLLERYGIGRRFSPRLSRVARVAARRCGLRVRGVLLPPAMGVDAIPFVHRGVPCLTLASGSLGPASWSVHSRRDRFEHLDGEALEQVACVAGEMILELSRNT